MRQAANGAAAAAEEVLEEVGVRVRRVARRGDSSVSAGWHMQDAFGFTKMQCYLSSVREAGMERGVDPPEVGAPRKVKACQCQRLRFSWSSCT